MSEVEAMIAAVHADPADPLPRLQLADWLEEHGEQSQADFIRLDMETPPSENWSDEERDLWVEALNLAGGMEKFADYLYWTELFKASEVTVR